MNWFLDLPNLTSITSNGYSFVNPRSITLSSSILNIEWWIDIPNLQIVSLPNSFRNVLSTSITSICMNINEWIDVSTVFSDIIPVTYSCDSIELIDSNATSIYLLDRTCNQVDYMTSNFSRFNLLERLSIGNDSFVYVNKFIIDGLNELKSLVIGMNSFRKNNGNDESRSFHVLNCIELKSIEIGQYSFSDYGGGFELFNLPKLTTIKIGEIGSDSYNFCYSSFVIKGIMYFYIYDV